VGDRDKVIEAVAVKWWPFTESPGDFTNRVANYSDGPGGLLAGLRTALIEEPPTLNKEYIARALHTNPQPDSAATQKDEG
jgi:hypothetical protein